MKKLINLFIVLMVFSLAFSPLSALAETINFKQPLYDTPQDTDFTVAVNIEDAVDVTNVHFVISYNTDNISYNYSPFPSSFAINPNFFSCGMPPLIGPTVEGELDIPMFICDSPGNGFNGSAKLADITFHASSTDVLEQLEITSFQIFVGTNPPIESTIGSPAQIIIGNPDLEDPTLSILSPTNETDYTYINPSNALTISGTSSDDILVDKIEYNINGGANLDAIGTSSWEFDASLIEGENTVNVIAYDTAGKYSSSTLIVDYSSDTIAPIISDGFPSSALSSGTTQATLSVHTNNEPATCRYSTTTNTAYVDMTNTMASSSNGLTHTATVTGLSNGTTYNYYVQCSDSLDNINDSDYPISFSVNSPSSSGSSGGGSYTPPTPVPTPSLENPISEYTATREEDKITLTWVNPEDDFESIIIIRSVDEILDYLSYEAILGLGEKLYEGSEETFVDTNIEPNLKYYYALFIKYADTYSKPLVIAKDRIYSPDEETPVPTLYNPEGDASDYSDIKSLGGIKSNIVEIISFSEGQKIYNQNTQVSLSNTTRRLYDLIVNQSPHDLNNQDRYAIAYFIHEGTPTTIILGAGERTGVLNSYLSVFDKLPCSEEEWQDVVKIANGRWPTERNLDHEKSAQDKYFITIYKRNPDMNNPHDNAAVTVITYGLRPAERSLFNELAAVNIFQSIYGNKPSSALDWDIVRAIAYSGAIR
jgi:hypothetical protein